MLVKAQLITQVVVPIYGDLLRDHTRGWFLGFLENYGIAINSNVELHAIFKGLDL